MSSHGGLKLNYSPGVPTRDSGPTLEELQSRCCDTIATAYEAERHDPQLVKALPGIGKSHNAVKAATRTTKPVTILTDRGREEQYEQLGQWCDEYGLTWRPSPSAYEECPTLAGEHGADWEREARQKYKRGATARDLHEVLDMPCTEDGSCPYSEAWDFDGEDFNVLLGHYTHAHVGKAVEGRVVVVDEFPRDAYLRTVDPGAVSRFLQDQDLPYDGYTNLVEGRKFDGPRREALSWFEGRGPDLREGKAVAEDESDERHALAPLAVLTLLKADDLGNGWEHAPLGGGEVGIHDGSNAEVHLLTPPDFSGAEGVVCLDGTPTKDLWDLALGLQLKQRQVLTEAERREYVRDVQGLRLVQTTEAVLPYSSGTYVNEERDAALLHEVARKHGTTPGVITSSTALQALESVGDDGMADEGTAYYGNFKGSNKLAEVPVGVILGSPHHGDPKVEKWAALAGERTTSDRKQGESYGEFGDRVRHHMREHEVLQALFRFSRQGEGATVYVHTSALPEWVPLAAGPDECEIQKRGPGEKLVMEALADLGSARTAGVVDQIDKEVTPRWVRTVANRLASEGVVRKEPDPEDGRGGAKRYYADGIGDANPLGSVTLPAINEEGGFSELPRIGTLYVAPPKKPPQPWEDPEEGRRWMREEWPKLKKRRERQRRQTETEIWRKGGI